jgi:hypothetical protein
VHERPLEIRFKQGFAMNDYWIVLKPAKLAVILLMLAAALSLAAVTGLARYRSAKEQTLIQTGQQLSATRDNIKALTDDLSTINKLAEKYRQLVRLGFIGEPNRDGWVQRLETLYRDMHLPPNLRYTLATPQLINPQPDAPAYQNKVLHHDLNMELSAIHEGELLDFMEKLSEDWQVPYRIETCQMTREPAEETISGLQIKCILQIYSLPDKG